MATPTDNLSLPISSLHEADAVLRQLPVGVIVAEAPDGRVIALNERAQELWAGPLPTCVEEYDTSCNGFRPDGRQYEADEWPLARALRHGEVVSDEQIEVCFPSGERRIVMVSATPVLDEHGVICKAVALTQDVTEARQEERRREFLMELSDELRLLDDAATIMETAAVVTGEHLGVSSASYADVDPDESHALVEVEYRHGRVAGAGKYYLEDFGPELIERLRGGGTVSIEDLGADASDVLEGWGIRSLLVAPIVRKGRLVALFSILHSAPRAWTRSDLALVEQVAERTWHAVENARVEAQLRQSREWLSLALRSGSAAVWEWNLRTGEIEWSEEHYALIGATSRRALTFERWLALVHEEDRQRARAAARKVVMAREGELEFEYRLAGSSEPRWISMRGRILPDPHGVPARVIGIAVDTTDRKLTELEREDLLRQAREASEAKSQFISVISHEFRTPLAAVIGYADLLSSGVSGEFAPAQLRQLDRIRASAWHLTQMVDEILTFSRIEAGHEKAHWETTDVAALAREAGALVAPGAAAKGLNLVCELPDEEVLIRTDSGKLRQILLNLLGNAVKFTQQGVVTLRVRRADDGVRLTVRDTGVGISNEDAPRVYERFWQGGAATSGSGTGLGLTVCRHLADLLGGTISLESEVGVGSTFHVHLPV